MSAQRREFRYVGWDDFPGTIVAIPTHKWTESALVSPAQRVLPFGLSFEDANGYMHRSDLPRLIAWLQDVERENPKGETP